MATHALKRPAAPVARMALTKTEAAQSVGVSPRYIELEAAAGRLKIIKAGRKVLVRPEDLAAWLESRSVSGEAR